MASDRNPKSDIDETELETTGLANTDWDDIAAGKLVEETADPENALDGEVDGDLTEEDDDNPFGESDEALPEESEEKVLARNPSMTGGRFEDV